jgi:tRNA(fMet)-specific endonuclease VapC
MTHRSVLQFARFLLPWPHLMPNRKWHVSSIPGSVISQPDLWIAAITRAAGGIIVTNNSDEFSRIPGLMLEDWLQS